MTESQNRQKTHFKQLDGLRCIAVLLVLIHHWCFHGIMVLIPPGPRGVDLFFVLSGFLITRILLISKDENAGSGNFQPIKRFYIRRFLRISPIYYLTIFFLLLIGFPSVKENIMWLLTNTFNIKLALPNYTGSVYISHFWTLNVEEQFYIFFPITIFLIPKTQMKSFFYCIIMLGLLSRVTLHFISASTWLMYSLTPCCFDAFGMGSLLAYCLLYETDSLKNILKKNYLFYSIAAIYIIDTIYSVARDYIGNVLPFENDEIFGRFLFSLCCFWIVGKATLGVYKGFIKNFLENRVVVFIGKISYGIYIYHFFAFPIITWYIDPVLIKYLHVRKTYLLDPAGAHNSMIMTTLCFFVFTMLLASLSWYCIELPVNKLKERIKY